MKYLDNNTWFNFYFTKKENKNTTFIKVFRKSIKSQFLIWKLILKKIWWIMLINSMLMINIFNFLHYKHKFYDSKTNYFKNIFINMIYFQKKIFNLTKYQFNIINTINFIGQQNSGLIWGFFYNISFFFLNILNEGLRQISFKNFLNIVFIQQFSYLKLIFSGLDVWLSWNVNVLKQIIVIFFFSFILLFFIKNFLEVSFLCILYLISKILYRFGVNENRIIFFRNLLFSLLITNYDSNMLNKQKKNFYFIWQIERYKMLQLIFQINFLFYKKNKIVPAVNHIENQNIIYLFFAIFIFSYTLLHILFWIKNYFLFIHPFNTINKILNEKYYHKIKSIFFILLEKKKIIFWICCLLTGIIKHRMFFYTHLNFLCSVNNGIHFDLTTILLFFIVFLDCSIVVYNIRKELF